ncbi:hypothetical protein BJY04DRAFT_184437, partial [Aspergillus karnatakaensis]|uniref:uncharacterized protein n=1 Tax=Aspergillus karnatakaensis TaxID=1810916 RepID=UPI003CCCF745
MGYWRCRCCATPYLWLGNARILTLHISLSLFENLTNPLPVIPIPDGPSLFTSLQEYMANLETIPVANPSPGDSVALLAHATSGPVTLCEQTTYILSDLYPSFKALSKAARVGEGQDMLVDYLGEEQAGRIFKFWREDVL